MMRPSKHNSAFLARLGTYLTKFKDTSTVAVAHDQLRQLFEEYPFPDIVASLAAKLDVTQHLSDRQKKEYSKILLSRIHPVQNISGFLNHLLTVFRSHAQGHKVIKQIVENLPSIASAEYQSDMIDILVEKATQQRGKAEYIDAILSAVLALEEHLNCQQAILPLLVKNIKSDDWNTRKVCVECCYALLLVKKNVGDNLHKMVEALKYDKIKHVRDAVANYLALYRQQTQQNQEEDEAADSRFTASIDQMPSIEQYRFHSQPTMNDLDDERGQTGDSVVVNDQPPQSKEKGNSYKLAELIPEDNTKQKGIKLVKRNHDHHRLSNLESTNHQHIFPDVHMYESKVVPAERTEMDRPKERRLQTDIDDNRHFGSIQNGLDISAIQERQHLLRHALTILQERIMARFDSLDQRLTKIEKAQEETHKLLSSRQEVNNMSPVRYHYSSHPEQIILSPQHYISQPQYISQQPQIITQPQQIITQPQQIITQQPTAMFGHSPIAGHHQMMHFTQGGQLMTQPPPQLVNPNHSNMLTHVQSLPSLNNRELYQPYLSQDHPSTMTLQGVSPTSNQNTSSNTPRSQQSIPSESNLEEKINICIENNNINEAFSLVLSNNHQGYLFRILEKGHHPTDDNVNQCLFGQIRRQLGHSLVLKWLRGYLTGNHQHVSKSNLEKLRKDIQKAETSAQKATQKGHKMLRSQLLNQIEEIIDKKVL